MDYSIPMDYVVKINPIVLSVAGSALDLNALYLTPDKSVPMGSILPFASAGDAAKHFGSQSQEALAARVTFNGYSTSTKKAGAVFFVQFNEAPVAAYTRGGSVSSLTLEDIRAITGSLAVTIDGQDKTAVSVNLAAATSFSNAATILSTALSALVTYDDIRQAFVVSSATTGETSTISYVTGTASDGLMLSQPMGAVISAGADAANIQEFMDNIVTNMGFINWAVFSTVWEPDTATKLEFSEWTNSRSPRFCYVGWDTSAVATQQGETTSWGYQVGFNSLEGTCLAYGTLEHAALICGYASALDFDRADGRSTLAFKYQGGITPYVKNASEAYILESKRYNFYGRFATPKENNNFMLNSAISGKWKWLDSYLNQIWISANAQLALAYLLMGKNSIPYNVDGYADIEAALIPVAEKAKVFGAIRTGVELSESQKQQVNTSLRRDVVATLKSKGYIIDVQPATADIRTDRTSPPISLYYCDGGSIQRLNLASVMIM